MRLVLAVATLSALAGCSLVDGDPARIGFAVELSDGVALEASVRLDGRDVALPEQPTTGGALFYAEPVDVSDGRRTVACAVSNGAPTTRGEVHLDLEAGWRYSVVCSVGRQDPFDLCFGCQGSEAFALDPALGRPAGDSLFVVWGGHDPDNPVLY